MSSIESKKRSSAFVIGIVFLSISIILNLTLVQIVIQIYHGVYNSIFVFAWLFILCGSLVETKKASYQAFAIPLVLFALEYVTSVDYFSIVHAVFFALMSCVLLLRENKKFLLPINHNILIVGCVVLGGCSVITDVWNQFRASSHFIEGLLRILICVTYYIGLALVMKRMLEHKQKADRKKKLTVQAASPEESLAELKKQYDAGVIDENEFNTLRNDIINKL